MDEPTDLHQPKPLSPMWFTSGTRKGNESELLLCTPLHVGKHRPSNECRWYKGSFMDHLVLLLQRKHMWML